MLKDIAEAMLGRRPFDLVIRNVQIVNVFSASIVSGSIGIVNGHIAGVFGPHLRNKHLMGGAQNRGRRQRLCPAWLRGFSHASGEQHADAGAFCSGGPILRHNHGMRRPP